MRFVLLFVTLLMLAGIVLLSCSSSPTKPTPESFGLIVAVHDSVGKPVPELEVSVWSDLRSTDSSVALAAMRTLGSGQLGDADCDGNPFTYADAAVIKQYLLRGSQSGDSAQCVISNANVVTASPGVTIADYYYERLRAGNSPRLDGRRLATRHEQYFFNDSTGALWFAGDSLIAALWLLTNNFLGANDDFQFDTHANEGVWRTVIVRSEPVDDFLLWLHGPLVAMEGVDWWGAPIVFTRQAQSSGLYFLTPNPSDSLLRCRIQTPYCRSACVVVHDLAGHRVDSIYQASVCFNGAVNWMPPATTPTAYKFTLSVFEAPGVTFTTSSYAAIEPQDTAAHCIGYTDSKGQVATTDKNRFPALSSLPELLTWDSTTYLTTHYRYGDSVVIVVRDTASGVAKRAHYGMTRGKNDIKITWP